MEPSAFLEIEDTVAPGLPNCGVLVTPNILAADLHSKPLRHPELPEQAAIQVEDARSPQQVAAAAEAHGRDRTEGVRIEVGLAETVSAQNGNRRQNLAGRLRTPPWVETI
jgi:hypothetical protein